MANTDSLAKYETIEYKRLDTTKLNVFRNRLNKVITEPAPTLLCLVLRLPSYLNPQITSVFSSCMPNWKEIDLQYH